MTLDAFYPVVPDAAWVRRVVAGGARLVQLRMKGVEPETRRSEVSAAMAACEGAGATLVLNDFWQLALEAGVGFVHLGQEDLAEADLPALRARGVRLGLSTHDEAELERALACDPAYVALGPIYPTRLKAMPWAPQGLERVSAWKRHVGARPLVAIGGITVPRVAGVRAAGADCVAVVTDIVTADDPEARIAAWRNATLPR